MGMAALPILSQISSGGQGGNPLQGGMFGALGTMLGQGNMQGNQVSSSPSYGTSDIQSNNTMQSNPLLSLTGSGTTNSNVFNPVGNVVSPFGGSYGGTMGGAIGNSMPNWLLGLGGQGRF